MLLLRLFDMYNFSIKLGVMNALGSISKYSKQRKLFCHIW